MFAFFFFFDSWNQNNSIQKTGKSAELEQNGRKKKTVSLLGNVWMLLHGGIAKTLGNKQETHVAKMKLSCYTQN